MIDNDQEDEDEDGDSNNGDCDEEMESEVESFEDKDSVSAFEENVESFEDEDSVGAFEENAESFETKTLNNPHHSVGGSGLRPPPPPLILPDDSRNSGSNQFIGGAGSYSRTKPRPSQSDVTPTGTSQTNQHPFSLESQQREDVQKNQPHHISESIESIQDTIYQMRKSLKQKLDESQIKHEQQTQDIIEDCLETLFPSVKSSDVVITTKLAEKEEIGEEGGGGRDDGIGIITPGLLPPEEYKDQIPGQIQQKLLLQQDNRNTSDPPPAQPLEDEPRRELHAQRHIAHEPSTVSRLVSGTHGDSESFSVLQPSEGYDDVQHQSGFSERGEYDSHRLGNQDEEFERG